MSAQLGAVTLRCTRSNAQLPAVGRAVTLRWARCYAQMDAQLRAVLCLYYGDSTPLSIVVHVELHSYKYQLNLHTVHVYIIQMHFMHPIEACTKICSHLTNLSDFCIQKDDTLPRVGVINNRIPTPTNKYT